MSRLGLFVFLSIVGTTAWGAIGEPCVNGACAPGEVCVPDAEAGYCTGRCPAAGCPEGMRCDEVDGIELCRPGQPPMRAEFGSSCAELPCEAGLVCVTDGPERYCSRACAGAAACPVDYRCAGGAVPACARRDGAPGLGDRCVDTCAPDLVCQGQGADFLFCTTDCATANECGSYLKCTAGRCELPDAVSVPFGGACASTGLAVPIRCADGLSCYENGLEAYCAGPCSPASPCPTGFGCIGQDDGDGACRLGLADEPGFAPSIQRDLAVPPPAPVDAGLEPSPTDAGGEGCNSSGQGGRFPAFMWLVALVGLVSGRRRTRRFP